MDEDGGGTVVDEDGDGAGVDVGGCDGELDDGGLAVDGVLGVEDEVANAVVDFVATVLLDGLQGVGVVADEDVGSGVDERVGLHPLLRYGPEAVFFSPMQCDDDDGLRLLLPEAADA